LEAVEGLVGIAPASKEKFLGEEILQNNLYH
jgi:hypothetical protein